MFHMMTTQIIRSQAKCFPMNGEGAMFVHFPKALKTRWVEKSTDVNDSLLDFVLRLTAVGIVCILNLLRDFRNSAGLIHHLWFLHVDDLFNRDSLQWNAVNNLNDLLHRKILHALLCSDLHNFHEFFHNSF